MTSLINQKGKIELDYQILIESQENYISVILEAIIPGNEGRTFLDSVSVINPQSTSNGILEAFLKAENKWGLDLVKLQPDNLKVQ